MRYTSGREFCLQMMQSRSEWFELISGKSPYLLCKLMGIISMDGISR